MQQPSRKTALITGASSGLGAEFASQLAGRGYDLILVARRLDRLEQVASSIEAKSGIHPTVISADLSKLEGIEKVIEIIQQTDTLELLVNNAGFGVIGRFLKTDPEIELSMLQVHMTAPAMLCRAALPRMVSSNHGAIINVASLAGLIPARFNLYGPTKAFLVNFSQALHAKLQDSHIHIQALCPGYFQSEFHDTPQLSRFSRNSIPKFLWLSTQQVVNESLNALGSHKLICIPGGIYRFLGSLAQNSITSGILMMIVRMVLNIRQVRSDPS